MKKTNREAEGSAFSWAVPEELGIPPDQLRLRLDFYHQAVEMTFFEDDIVTTKMVSAMDVAFSLASELSFGTGLLPPDTLWWKNTRGGPIYALYTMPKIRKVALLQDARKAPRRFTIPLPGFIFLCRPGQPPWVYAVKKRPTKDTDIVYNAPLCNIFANGRTCPGNHRYPERVADMEHSFFMSFFTPTANLTDRSLKFPQNIVLLWEYLDKKKAFPMCDLVQHATIGDLMSLED